MPQASGERTEKATPKRRRDARKKGQVVKSVELTAAVVLLMIYLGFSAFGPFIMANLKSFMREFVSGTYFSLGDNFGENYTRIYLIILKYFVIICGPILAIALFGGMLLNYLQVGFLFEPSLLAMKFSKINPLNGFRRIFSLRSLVTLLQSSLKLALVAAVVYKEFEKNFVTMTNLINLNIDESVSVMISLISTILWKSGLTLFILGVIDYGYLRWEHERELRMTKQEVKEEYKLLEGDPKIKSRIKTVQRQISMRRMMQHVPTADVVITNPTHYAVALIYDEKTHNAPVVVAKGQDYVALKIKEIAKEHGVYIEENKPLAQSLYKMCDIGQEIPSELYQAVAEILAFVYSLKK